MQGAAALSHIFASYPAGAIFLRLTAEKKRALTVHFTLDSQLRHDPPAAAEATLRCGGVAPSHAEPDYVGHCDNAIVYSEASPGMLWEMQLCVLDTDGTVCAEAGRLTVKNAARITLAFTAQDSYRGYGQPLCRDSSVLRAGCTQTLQQAAALGWDAALRQHQEDYEPLFRRVAFHLGSKDAQAAFWQVPTDVQLQKAKQGEPDATLFALYFQFARYLMLACSRPGTQAANLQGIWNEDLRPAWSSNYTTNINVEMNYWPVCAIGLPECFAPMQTLIEEIRLAGRETAQKQYGCRGWAANHNVDLWRQTNPVSGLPVYAYWPMGGVWMASHLYDTFEYTQDRQFLKDTVQPVLAGCVDFCLDFLVEKNGVLYTCPSTTPENTFLDETGVECCISRSTTLDITLLRELFSDYTKTMAVLGQTDARLAAVRTAMEKLPPFQIGPDGCLQEWLFPFAEKDMTHRHFSPVYGLFPGGQIHPDKTPELAQACRRLIDKRLQNRDKHTGWSCAWLICLYAQLRDGPSAYGALRQLLADSTFPNLFDLHPPLGVGFEGEKAAFQIDGNFGGAEGIVQTLLQSDGETLALLPALPPAWQTGSVTGLRAKGGWSVDLWWKDGAVEKAALTPLRDSAITVRSRNRLFAGGGSPSAAAQPDAWLLKLSAAAGRTLVLTSDFL